MLSVVTLLVMSSGSYEQKITKKPAFRGIEFLEYHDQKFSHQKLISPETRLLDLEMAHSQPKLSLNKLIKLKDHGANIDC